MSGLTHVLVLTRKTDQGIVFDGEDIEVYVLEIRGNKVRLGINAPNDVTVLRSEVAFLVSEDEHDGND